MLDKKFLSIVLVVIVVTALVLSWLWHVPYIYTVIGFSAWAIIGQIVTVDDELSGGWSNPDGNLPYPWKELFLKLNHWAGKRNCRCV